MSLSDVRVLVQREIARLSQVLRLLGDSHASAKKAARKKRTMSAAGRRRIAAAQRARWAKIRAAKK
jgi:hypothetical protein